MVAWYKGWRKTEAHLTWTSGQVGLLHEVLGRTMYILTSFGHLGHGGTTLADNKTLLLIRGSWILI